jgi:hypothetical protein
MTPFSELSKCKPRPSSKIAIDETDFHRTFDHFANHIHTNTIGPIIVAQKLLRLSNVAIGTVAFMSSDSGSTTRFLAFEDG